MSISDTVVVFWQNQPSMHQCSMQREVAKLPGYRVILVSESNVSESRRSLGWTYPNLGNVQQIVSPNRAQLKRLIENLMTVEAIHIFSGMSSYKMVSEAFNALVHSPSIRGIYAEAPDPRGFKGALRLVRDRYRSRAMERDIDFILAAGRMGAEWYENSGFARSCIFPFAYWVDDIHLPRCQEHEGARSYTISYVGRLIRLKGVDLLLAALASLRSKAWRLNVVGEGRSRRRLMRIARNLGIDHQTEWFGVLKNPDALRVLASSDLLALPSRYDGWGAVVNEAISLGVPVICSDSCGAAILVEACGVGGVFRSGDISSLRSALDAQLRRGKPTADLRRALQSWGSCMSGESGALYLHRIIRHVLSPGTELRPVPPWASMVSVNSKVGEDSSAPLDLKASSYDSRG